MKLLLLLIISFFLPFPEVASATQVHGTPEGIYTHQLAHLFFMLSMMLLIYRLRQRKLIKHTGWRYIQYAAFFLILWNADVMLVHFIDEQTMLITMEKVGDRHIRVESSLGKWVEITYLVATLDHFICVPAFLFLFLGLRKLVTETEKSPEDQLR